jgi:hypothetical protein
MSTCLNVSQRVSTCLKMGKNGGVRVSTCLNVSHFKILKIKHLHLFIIIFFFKKKDNILIFKQLKKNKNVETRPFFYYFP